MQGFPAGNRLFNTALLLAVLATGWGPSVGQTVEPLDPIAPRQALSGPTEVDRLQRSYSGTLVNYRRSTDEIADQLARAKEMLKDLERTDAELVADIEKKKKLLEQMSNSKGELEKWMPTLIKPFYELETELGVALDREKELAKKPDYSETPILNEYQCRESGVVTLMVKGKPKKLLCNMSNQPGFLIQQRTKGQIDFYRNWGEYVQGFGNLETTGEFWLGLELISAITLSGRYRLRVELRDKNNIEKYVVYDSFIVAGKEEGFRLIYAGTNTTGPAGDGLGLARGDDSHVRAKFSTKDRDNDTDGSKKQAVLYQGGWWYSTGAYLSNLNGAWGKYRGDEGVRWRTGISDYPLEFTRMKLVRMS